MHLADIRLLSREDAQLLADCLQPVFVLELTPISKSLIQRELLHAFPAICQHSQLTCYVLTTTDKGGAYVAAWIADPINLRVCQKCAEQGRPTEPVHKLGMSIFWYRGKRHQLKPERMRTRARQLLSLVHREESAAPGWVGLLVLAFVLLGFNGCGYYSAPKLIEADGTSYVACSGVVRVSSDSGLFGSETTYSISFTNDAKIDTVVKGVRNVTITSIPTMIKSSLQAHLPDPKTESDKTSQPFVEGSTFLSGPGDKIMTFRNGVWVPEMNPGCYGPK